MELNELIPVLHSATRLHFKHVRDVTDRFDRGKSHRLLHCDELGVQLLVKTEQFQSYDASLARLLEAAAVLEVAGVIWVAPSFLDKHRRVLDFLNSGLGSEIGFAAVATGPATPSLWCGQVGPVGKVVAVPSMKPQKLDVGFWENLRTALADSHPRLQSARICNATSRPWIRVDLPDQPGVGLYVDAFQVRRPMYAGAFAIGARKDAWYDRLEDRKAEFEARVIRSSQSAHDDSLVWLKPGINPETNNVVTKVRRELAVDDPNGLITTLVGTLGRFDAALADME